MRYVTARYNQQRRDLAYRIYLTDGLKSISENLSRVCGGSYLNARLVDLIDDNKPIDKRTGDEVAADVIKAAGLKLIKKGKGG